MASVALSPAAILPVVYGIKELAVHGAGTPTAPGADHNPKEAPTYASK